MPGTVHERSADQAASKVLRSGEGAWLDSVQKHIKAKTWESIGPGYTAAVGQPYGGWTPGQLWAAGKVHTQVLYGSLARVYIDAGRGPAKDQARDRNQQTVWDLPEPFVASVDPEQYGSDFDGTLTWSEPIRATLETGDDQHIMIDPGSAPLEIGTCMPSRMWLHIYEVGAVARWPYGCPWIWLLVGAPHPLDYAVGLRADLTK
jgi:hypothetical protein